MIGQHDTMSIGMAMRMLGIVLSFLVIFVLGDDTTYNEEPLSVPVVPHMFRTVFALNSLLYTFINNSTAYVTSTQFATGISGENGILSSGNWFYTFRTTIQAANQAAMFTVQKIFHKVNETETRHAFWWNMQGGLSDESSATVCSNIPVGPPCYAEGVDLTWLDPRNKIAPHDLSYAGNTTVFSPWGEVMGFENGTVVADWWRSKSACKDIFIGHIPTVTIQKYIDWVVAERELTRIDFALSEELFSQETGQDIAGSGFNYPPNARPRIVSDSVRAVLKAYPLGFDDFLRYQAEQLCASPVLIIREQNDYTSSLLDAEEEWRTECMAYVMHRREVDRSFILRAANTVEDGLRFFTDYLLSQNYKRMQPMMDALLGSSEQRTARNGMQHRSSWVPVAHASTQFPPHPFTNYVPPSLAIPVPQQQNAWMQDQHIVDIAYRWNVLSDAFSSVRFARVKNQNPLFYSLEEEFLDSNGSSSPHHSGKTSAYKTARSLAAAVKEAEIFPPTFSSFPSSRARPNRQQRRHSRYNFASTYSSNFAPRNFHTYRFPASSLASSLSSDSDASFDDRHNARIPPYLYHAPDLGSVPNLQNTLSQPVLYSAAEYQPSSGFCNMNNRSYNYHPSLHGFLPLTQASQTSNLFALPKVCENVTIPHDDPHRPGGGMISLLWYIISLCISFIIGCIVFYVVYYASAKRREENEADVRNNYLLYEEFQRLNAAYGEQQVQAYTGRVELM